MRDLKSYTSTQLRQAIKENSQESRREWMLWMMERAGRQNSNNNNFQFWQQHNQPITLNTNEMLLQKLQYIHQNPVTAGFVDEPEDYLYSSARNYSGRKGMLDIFMIE